MKTDRIKTLVGVTFVATLALGVMPAAQWLNHPTPGLPRTADGKLDTKAAFPRTAAGKPVLAGLWRPNPGLTGDAARGKPPDFVPYQPWAEELYKRRRASNSVDDPTAACVVGGVPRSDFVGYPFKILEVPGMMVILYEAVHSYRQIFTDGRPFPKDMNPGWFGYSVGKWEGDALVVESRGFNDRGWIDNAGKPSTDALVVTERFIRKDFGNLDIEITIDDSKAYTRPWTVVQPLAFQPDTELLEYMCPENNKYFDIIPRGAKGSTTDR